MDILAKAQHIERLQRQLTRNQRENFQVRLYEVLKERTARNTREERLVQSADTQEWYHLVWERMSDASFVYRMERDERLGKWVHDRTMEMVHMPLDDWIGPWYRERSEAEQVGSLETAHITLAVCEAYGNAGEAFSETEQKEIAETVRQKGMLLCRRYVERQLKSGYVSNWTIVILAGYGVASVFYGDEEDRKRVLEMEAQLSRLYNVDSYGETVQYSNYASLCFAHLQRVIVNAGWTSMEELHPESYFRLIEWYVYSFQRMKYLESFDARVPRTFSFGDSSNLFRPTADVLVQTAVWGRERYPRKAALASWLLEQTYGTENGLIDEMATFGFFNQFTYDTVMRLPDRMAARSPSECGLELVKRFEIGHVLARDSWTDPRMMVALAAGYEPLNVSGHRHADQNSFQLTLGEERMLVDPGHCCYRLTSQKKSMHETSHSNISIRCGEKLLEQRRVTGNVFHPVPVYNHLLACEIVGEVTVVISDATDLYPEPVNRVLRIFVMRLPEFVLIIDRVSADEPVSLLTRFVANNRDNCLETDDRTKHRLSLKRKGVELGIDVLQNVTDNVETDLKLVYDWSFLHEYYHPLPNQAGQGREGSALVFVWESTREAKDHRRVHLLTPNCRTGLTSPEKWMEENSLVYELTDESFRLAVGTELREWNYAL